MIYFPKSRSSVSYEAPVASGQLITAEGQGLVGVTTVGVYGVQPCTNSTTNKFVGFAVSEQLTLSTLPKVERFSVTGADGTTIVLAKTPSAANVFIYDVTGSVALAITTDWTRSGDTITWVTDQSGNDVDVFYRYSPTAAEAQAYQGDIKPGGAAGLILNQVGVFSRGVIYTSEYDTSVDWLAASPTVKTGASGVVTIGGSGSTLSAVVVAAPHSDGPDGAFLGLEFDASV